MHATAIWTTRGHDVRCAVVACSHDDWTPVTLCDHLARHAVWRTLTQFDTFVEHLAIVAAMKNSTNLEEYLHSLPDTRMALGGPRAPRWVRAAFVDGRFTRVNVDLV